MRVGTPKTQTAEKVAGLMRWLANEVSYSECGAQSSHDGHMTEYSAQNL